MHHGASCVSISVVIKHYDFTMSAIIKYYRCGLTTKSSLMLLIYDLFFIRSHSSSLHPFQISQQQKKIHHAWHFLLCCEGLWRDSPSFLAELTHISSGYASLSLPTSLFSTKVLLLPFTLLFTASFAEPVSSHTHKHTNMKTFLLLTDSLGSAL